MTSKEGDVVAVVLAAGLGTRLRPLTDLRPKALCPIGDKPLVDHALERIGVDVPVAVNVYHGREQMEKHLGGRVHLSIERDGPLGTAGALIALRDWISGRDVLIVNADAWLREDARALLNDPLADHPRLMVVRDDARADFGGRWRYTGMCVIPGAIVESLPADAFGLHDAIFSRVSPELVPTRAAFFDCGTPADYHAANMMWSDGRNVVGEGAVVEGKIERTVVWPGARVEADEVLTDAIRADGLTVFAR